MSPRGSGSALPWRDGDGKMAWASTEGTNVVRVNRVVPNIVVSDLQAAVAEHQAVLGFSILMDHGWIVTLGDEAGHQLSLMTRDATGLVNPSVSIFVDDVEKALEQATRQGLEIVHPLTEEPWGVTRFFYRDASGNVVNVGMHTPATSS